MELMIAQADAGHFPRREITLLHDAFEKITRQLTTVL